MPVSGTRIVARNILTYGGKFLTTVNNTMKGIEVILDKQVERNISLTDHTLKELADADHPYARRHGPQGTRIHSPYWLVHKQSGKLLESKESGTEKASISAGRLVAGAFVRLNPIKASHALHVIFGTSKMIPRPVLIGSRNQVVDKAMFLIKNKLKFLTVNFRGRETI